MTTPIDELKRLIGCFEEVYAGTGAGAEINLRNPLTGDPSDVALRYVRTSPGIVAGLYVSIQSGPPMRLAWAAPGVMARAAYHLPELADVLDAVAKVIGCEVKNGTTVLAKWLEARESDDYDENDDESAIY